MPATTATCSACASAITAARKTAMATSMGTSARYSGARGMGCGEASVRWRRRRISSNEPSTMEQPASARQSGTTVAQLRPG